MFTAQSPASRGLTGATGRSSFSEDALSTDFPNKPPTSSARFGSLSHHSFFSRHNPHPHRVRHIQGLNGRPVCSVRDDWYVTSSLFPHPLLKSHVFRTASNPSFAFPPAQRGDGGNKGKSALFSEAWRDELKELAAKVRLSPPAKKEEPEEEFVRRKTQYSAETGRIVPPSSKSYQRRSQRLPAPQAFHDQELMVLELLCQILQTDSLSTVQQWLLLACQREKDMVMEMIKRALEGVDLSGHHHHHHHHQKLHPLQALHPGAAAPDQRWRRPQRSRTPVGGSDKRQLFAGAALAAGQRMPQI
ncbi:protein TBATA [Brachionichthys hirsutus]|uniref:protein TBATA n=1 Tax=Brachionichthys hirsutus TaxID=412623 RepID=UPI003604ED58